MNHNITPQLPLGVGSLGVAAGTGDTQTFNEIDMLAVPGAIGVRIIVLLGAMVAGATARLNCKGSDVSNTYGAGTIGNYATAAEEPLATGAGDQNGFLTLEIYKPRNRFLRPQLARAGGANTTVISVAYEYIVTETPAPALDVRGTRRVLNNPVPSAS